MRDRRQVVLVGAGPGDPSLVTEAAREAFRRADMVFYDALVSPEILQHIPIHKRICVGKRGGMPSPAQENINRRLIAAACAGRRVVRLKGGDPFLFGRGGEEAAVLRKRGIRVLVVPGISSGMAAASYAGFPLTDRRYASSVTFLTASSAADRADSNVSAALKASALVRLGGTWVFFMGLKMLPDIVRKLLKAGADPNLPAATVSRATTPFQRVVTAPLSDIADAVARNRIESPALTIIGRVVSLRPPPLQNVPVLVMRPEHQAGRLSKMLEKKRGDVTDYPVLDIVPIQPNRRLQSSVRRLPEYDWIFLTSANTVRILKKILRMPARGRRRAKIAAIGPGTAAALRDLRVRVDLQPVQNFIAEGLAETFLKKVRGRQNIWIPQAADAREILVRTLRRAGHKVDAVPIYRTRISTRFFGKIRAWVKNVEAGLVPLTSASMAGAFARAIRGISVDHLRLVSIGPVTTAAAMKAGLRVAAESPAASLGQLVETLETTAPAAVPSAHRIA